MDGDEDEFFSGNHSGSDDGGGTPVQDEHAPDSDAEEMSEPRHSEDEGSDGEGATSAMETNGIASGSDNEGPKVANSDSEEEAPNHSDSEPEAPRPADSDAEESPVKGRISTSDVEGSPGPERRGSISDIEGSSVKRRGSTSDTEGSPVNRRSSPSDVDGHATSNRGGSHSDVEGSPLTKHKDSNSDVEGYPVKCRGSASDIEGSPFNHRGSPSDLDGSPTPKRTGSTSDIEESPVKHRGSSSDLEEEKPKMAAANSDSDNEDRPPSPAQKRHSNAHSDSETEIPKNKEPRELGGEKAEKKGKWKAVMHSDSDDDMKARPTKAAPSSDPEDVPAKRVVDDSEDDDEMPMKRKKAILSDSEDEKADKPATKKSRAVSDDDNSDSEAGSDAPDKTMAKLRELGSDSEDEDARTKAEGGKKDEKTLFGSDSESGDEEEKMIADIFGESDEEEEEFTGFNQEDLEGDKGHSKALEKKEVADDSDSDEGVDRGGGQDTSFMSDFDVMLARKKAQSGKRRRNRDGGTFISDADDVVSAMITKMTEAAEEDRTLNAQKKPALKKLTLLPTVVMHLKKQDLKETFIDSGVMTAIKEWIGPLPDKSLPALKIREELLKILQELPSVSQETLKHSGIGRAVMFLYKHPKESRPNKDLALKLINEWSRPIFGLTSNYKGMTREERQQRDLDQQMPQKRRLSQPQKVVRSEEPDVFSPQRHSSGGQTPRRDLEKVLTGEEKALRPGDPGFCARARVPMPSNKDYVVRPKWNVESESRSAPVKKGVSRVDKQLRRFADIKRMTKTGHAVKISVQGNRMPL
ncbi:protein IWS1 homolog isoform X1 [Esox lucius]|uniref:TFIIS N-terminal domain-containing protein n=1 Tax=Esox lucius TaxID=8010 RepID=A0A3P8XTL9_ESOLU|nr:protein IWS1 homolog isoform X1 [Esox lucius]